MPASSIQLAGIALVARMEAFAGITGSLELVDSEMPMPHACWPQRAQL